MGSARRKRRSRAGGVLKLLLALLVIAGIAAAYPAWRTVEHATAHAGPGPAPGPPELTVEYRTSTTTATTAVATPQLFVTDSSTKPIPLADVTIRYYFAADGASSFGFNCLQAGVGCSDITGSIGVPGGPAPSTDRFLQIGFAPGAGTLAPGENSRGIELQLYRLDHEDMDQSADWSFDPAITTYKPSPRVTAYLRGTLVWGQEPGGAAVDAAPSPSATASPQGSSTTGAGAASTPALPAGIVFDDFHYTGADDPALLAHGWQARTGAGGPGIHGTWSTSGVSFPAVAGAEGGQALQLQASTDGTESGTRQAELQSTAADFFTGTYAARIYFSNQPATGPDGDHVNESFYPISPDADSPDYSELDNEYMPNGGWGAPGPAFDTTSWYSAALGERVTRRTYQSLQGWHTLMITAVNDTVTYSLDGEVLFTSRGEYVPREDMGVHFNEWFIDLPFTGERSWDMQVNWFYYAAGKAESLQDVRQAVSGFYSTGANYVNTLPGSAAR